MAVTEQQQIMALISKRLRALRKKNNRIIAMEESVSQGKTLNKEQKETILSKPIVTALIEELEKLRLPSPPSAAVTEEQRKETAEEDCKISDGLNDNDDGEVSKDNTSPACSETSQGVTQSPTSVPNGKPRRKRKSKKPQTTSK